MLPRSPALELIESFVGETIVASTPTMPFALRRPMQSIRKRRSENVAFTQTQVEGGGPEVSISRSAQTRFRSGPINRIVDPDRSSLTRFAQGSYDSWPAKISPPYHN